jgi:hypothetical protein
MAVVITRIEPGQQARRGGEDGFEIRPAAANCPQRRRRPKRGAVAAGRRGRFAGPMPLPWMARRPT